MSDPLSEPLSDLGPNLYVQFCLILSVIVADCIKFHSEPSVLHDLVRDLSCSQENAITQEQTLSFDLEQLLS